jgi:hypothetical protein
MTTRVTRSSSPNDEILHFVEIKISLYNVDYYLEWKKRDLFSPQEAT